MRRYHVLFFLAPQYGHINPSLGMAIELVRRGHRVEYAVPESFSPVIRSTGAQPVVLDFLENREVVISNFFKESDHQNYQSDPQRLSIVEAAVQARTNSSLAQLEEVYASDLPNLIIRDDVLDRAGREFSRKFAIPTAYLRSQFIEGNLGEQFLDEELVVVTVPRFFQKLDESESVPDRYKFIGFTPEGRTFGFQPWKRLNEGGRPRVLVSPTTGLLKQLEFCRTVLDAFGRADWDVILSISGARDAYSAIGAGTFEGGANNIRINDQSANFEILPNVSLFIGQGGQGGVLEAIYHAVPQIVLPASPYHYPVGQRVEDLGMGYCMPLSSLSAEALVNRAWDAITDVGVRNRLRSAQTSMHCSSSAERAADVLEKYVKGK